MEAFTIWFTGLSGSGKSTLSRRTYLEIKRWGLKDELLDGDIICTNFSQEFGFTKRERDINVKRIGFLSWLLSKHGIVSVVAAIAPYEETHQINRKLIPNYIEMFYNCLLEVVGKRDPKGLYARAWRGEIPHFTGIPDPYEPPQNPEVTCCTDQECIEESFAKIIGYIEQKGLIPMQPLAGIDLVALEEERLLRERLRTLGFCHQGMGNTKPIKVLQLGSPTGLYGAERWILALIKHLDPTHIHTLVGVIKDDPTLKAPLLDEAHKRGFNTVAIEAFGRFNWKAITGLKETIRKYNIQILHTHGYKQDLVGLLATRGTPCRLLATPHGWSKEPDFKLWCYETLNRLVFLGADKVVPLSREIYDGLKRIPGLKKKLQLIENAVDLSELEQAQEIPSEVQKARREGVFILGYIGQLIHRKGVDILLQALALIPSQRFKAFIIGEGPLRKELEKLVKKLGVSQQVVFTGYRKDRLNFLRGFDIFILPSRLEGIPRCLMEAMGMGKPVIASDIEGCRSLIPKDGDQGLLFPINDPQALAERINHLMFHEKERQALGERARAFVAQKYSAQRMAKEYEALYQELLR